MAEYEFICDWAVNRSPTGARVLKEMAKARGVEISTDCIPFAMAESATGDSVMKIRLNKSKKNFVMEKERRDQVIRECEVPEEKVVNLDVPDDYDVTGKRRKADGTSYKTRQELEEVFRIKLEPYIDEICRSD